MSGTTERARRACAMVLLTALAGAALAARAEPTRVRPVVRLKNPFRPDKPAPPPGPLLRTATQPPFEHLSEAQYRDIRTAALELMGRFPPDRYFYLGVGRDPSPVLAFLENLSPDISTQIPASGIKGGVQAQHEPEYFRHLDRLLPAEVLKGGRSILLVDRSNVGSGRSLNAFRTVLQKYLQARGSSTAVEGVGYVQGDTIGFGLHVIDYRGFPEMQRFWQSQYEAVARYPYNVIGPQKLETLRENPAYGAFRAKMLERMQSDATLDGFLKRLGATTIQVDP